jgi:hypothetical protein
MEEAIRYKMPAFDYPTTSISPKLPKVATPAASSASQSKGNTAARKQNHSCDQCRKGKRKCDAKVDKISSDGGQSQNCKLPKRKKNEY